MGVFGVLKVLLDNPLGGALVLVCLFAAGTVIVGLVQDAREIRRLEDIGDHYKRMSDERERMRRG